VTTSPEQPVSPQALVTENAQKARIAGPFSGSQHLEAVAEQRRLQDCQGQRSRRPCGQSVIEVVLAFLHLVCFMDYKPDYLVDLLDDKTVGVLLLPIDRDIQHRRVKEIFCPSVSSKDPTDRYRIGVPSSMSPFSHVILIWFD
jgi:hypothetical protein